MRVGIVGSGWWAGFAHAPAFKQAGAQIAGVYSKTLSNAQKLASELGTRAFEDYQDLLAQVDLVAISTTDDTHARLGIEAIRAGKHLFMDKPLARTAEEGRAILEAARAQGVMGLTSFTSRGDLAAETAQRRVRDGLIGDIWYLRGFFHGGFMSNPATPPTWRARAETGGEGGAVADLGAHLFDLTRMVSGLEFTQVMAQSRIHIKRQPPVSNYDEGAVLARLGQATGSFSLSRIHTGGVQTIELELQGSKGALRVRPALWNSGADARLWFSPRPGDYRELEVDFDLLRGRDPAWSWGYFQFSELARRFMEGIQSGAPVSPTLEDGLATQQVIEATSRSTLKDAWEKVEP